MKNLNIKTKYRSLSNNLVEEFYIPVLSKSKYYYRAVGYFSSNILLNYVKGLRNLILNDGEMKLIMSPYITQSDYEELYSTINNPSKKSLLEQLFESFLSGDEKIVASSKLFVMLLNSGRLQVKVAEPMNVKGLFHEKIGIFIDKEGNKIAISGSNNETGNAVIYNYESFNAFCSWKFGQNLYVEEHLLDFNISLDNTFCFI